MRRSRWVINGLLLLVVVGLGLGLWWSLRSANTPPTTSQPVSHLAPNQIHQISVRHGATLIAAQRADNDHPWQLTEPVAAAADPVHMASLLQIAQAHASRHYALGAIADSATGLGDTAVVIRFNQAAPIRLGGPGPTPGTRYIATAHALLLVTLPHLAALDDTWAHWLNPALLAGDHTLTKLVLPDFTLSRDQQGNWQAAPVGQRSAAAAATTISAWQSAKALAVVPADTRRQRIARITLVFAQAATRHLDIIERAPNLVLRDPRLGVDYHLAGNRVPPLLDLQHPGLAPLPTNKQ